MIGNYYSQSFLLKVVVHNFDTISVISSVIHDW